MDTCVCVCVRVYDAFASSPLCAPALTSHPPFQHRLLVSVHAWNPLALTTQSHSHLASPPRRSHLTPPPHAQVLTALGMSPAAPALSPPPPPDYLCVQLDGRVVGHVRSGAAAAALVARLRAIKASALEVRAARGVAPCLRPTGKEERREALYERGRLVVTVAGGCGTAAWVHEGVMGA